MYRHTINRLKPWVSKIAIDGKRQYLGCYATEEEAARAFDAKAAKHGRELNFPDEWEDEEEEDDDDDDDHEVLCSKGHLKSKRNGSSYKYRGKYKFTGDMSRP